MTDLDYFLNVLERCRQEDAEMLARHSPNKSEKGELETTCRASTNTSAEQKQIQTGSDSYVFHQYEESSQINPEGRR